MMYEREKRAIARVVLLYVLFAGAWIVVSDWTLGVAVPDAGEQMRWSMYKGLAFVGATAALLYFLLRAEWSARRREERLRHDNEARYRRVFEANPHPMYVYDLETLRFLAVNDAAVAHYGWSRDEFLAMTITDIRPPEEATRLRDFLAQPLPSHFGTIGLWRHCKRDGTPIDVEISWHPLDFDGRPAMLVMAHDVTAREHAQRALARRNRLYALLSRTNELLLRATDRAALFDGICRIAVEEGGFRFAWIGLADADGSVRPVARAGADAGYIDAVDANTDAACERGNGPTGQALRSGARVVCNDFLAAAATRPWHDAARRTGVGSAAALPIRQGGRVIGTINLYAAERDFFSEPELAALDAMAADVSFGLDLLAREEERARLHRELERAEARWRYALEGAEHGVWEWNVQAGRIFHSRRWKAMLGYDDADVGDTLADWQDRVHPDDLAAVRAELQRHLAGATPMYRAEYRLRCKDGSYKWTADQGKVMARSSDGQPLLVIGTQTDISERRRADERLRASEQRYRILFDANPQPMWVIDRATLRFLAVNDAAVARYGWSRDEFLAMTIADIRPAEDVPRLLETVARKPPAEGLRASGLWRHRKRDGTLIDVEITAHGIELDGKPAVLVLAQDVTERLRAERVVRESERLARATLDALPAPIAILDDGGCIVLVNEAWRRFARQNSAAPETLCEGANYLAVCERARGEDALQARDFAAGIRDVISGRRARFGVEYACHSPSEERWFVAQVARFGGDGPVRAVVAHIDVTARRRAERAAAEQADRLRHYLSASPCVVYALAAADGERVPEWVSQNIRAVLHYSVQQARARGWWLDHVHPDDRAAALAATATLFETGKVEHSYRFRRGDGVWIWIHDQMRLQDTRAGTSARIIGAWTDVTAIREAQQALAASEQRFRAAFEQAIVGMAQTAPDDGRFLMCNQRLADMLGYTRDELLALRVRDVTHPDDHAEDLALAGRVLRGETNAYAREKRYLRKDGAVVWASVSGVLVRKADGAPDYFSGVYLDITERRRTEAALRMLSRAVEQGSESIVITDLDGRIEYVNDAFTRVTGYTRDEVLGRNPRLLQSGKTPPQTYRALWEALTSGREWRGEFHNRRKDGSEYVESAVVSPLRQADGTISNYVAVKTDVTERRRLEGELERYRHHLEELVAERTVQLAEARRQAEAANAAKSAFLANMSHEIRTPMNGVLGMLEVLARGRLSEQQAEMVRTAQESGRTLLGIIDDILDFSKIEAGKMQIERVPMSVLEVVEGLGDALLPLANRRDVDLNVFVAPEIPARVLSDPLRLRQILFNLIGNALKFSAGNADRRGRVFVRVTVAQQAPLRLAFAVIDNGIGMRPEVVARLFTPFSQAEASTTRRFGGSGLGLTICKRLADLMGGEIAVASSPGAGSVFTLTLPVEVAGEAPADTGPALDGVACVVVDSDELDVAGICAYLAHAGAHVHRAAGEAEAARIAAAASGAVVVIRSAGGAAPPQSAPRTAANVRQLWITRGRRRRPRMASKAVVTLDLSGVRRQALLRAVAIAAGRQSPESAAADAALARQPRAVPAPAAGDARRRGAPILVAEDDEVSAEVLGHQLALLGCAAEFVADGAAALRRWQQGRYALLLTDLHMPVMDGYELVTSIRAQEAARGADAPRLPIVALTANALRGEAEHAKTVGFDDYLTKPLRLDALRQALDRWLPATEPAPSARQGSAPAASDAVALDVGVLKGYVGDDSALLREVLAHYRQTLRQQADDLRAASARGDVRHAAGVAHKLKSSSRSVGALALGALCAEIERAGDAAAVAQRLPAFDAAVAEVETGLDAWLAQEGARK